MSGIIAIIATALFTIVGLALLIIIIKGIIDLRRRR